MINDFGHEWGDLPVIFTSDEVKIIGKLHHKRPKNRYSW